jgi:hypothetical protein
MSSEIILTRTNSVLDYVALESSLARTRRFAAAGRWAQADPAEAFAKHPERRSIRKSI